MKLNNPILKMFGQSPIHPLQQHMGKVAACTQALLPFFEMVYQGLWAEAKNEQQTIARLEEEADKLKTELAIHLPHSLFTAIPRADLLRMLYLQDKIANKAKDVAGLVYGRRMSIPDSIITEFKSYLENCIKAAHQAEQVVNELDELFATGFSGAEVSIIKSMVIELDKIENATDHEQVVIRQKIQPLENILPPVDIIFLYKVIDWTGDLADYAHHVGAQLQIMAAR